MPKRPVTPDDLYLLKTVFDPRLSPDGKRVAYVVSWADKKSDETHMSVYVAPANGRGPAQRFAHGKRDHSPRWSPDGRYLAFVSNRGEKAQIYLAPLDGGEPRKLTSAKFGVTQPAWSPDGSRLVYSARVGDYTEPKERKGAEKAQPRVVRDLGHKLDGIGFFDQRRFHLFTIDIESGKERQLTDGDWSDQEPAWSPDGRRIAFVSDRERERRDRHFRGDLWVVSSAGGRARKLTRSRGNVTAPSFSPDGRLIAFVGHEHGDEGSRNSHLLVLPATGGRAPRSVSAPIDRPVAGGLGTQTLAWSRDGRSVLFLASDRGATSLYRAGVANGSVSKLLGGDRQIEGFDLSRDGKRVYYASIWPTSPGEIYAAPLAGRGRERMLSHANDELRESVTFGRLGRIKYRAADGLEIETFVLYPPGYRPKRRYPVACNIHGGPHGVHPSGNALITHQAMAGAGYVVLLPNPRGSAGYGESFTQACVGDWGGKDYEDIMAGVDLLVRRGVADPERLYVGGYSYGGFMTSWAVGHTDRFRAATVGAPVANLVSMFGEGDIPLFDMHEIGGTPYDNEEQYHFRSPITYLPHVTTPVLLLHWEGDLRCPIGQSEEIFQGLKVLGKKVEFVRYPGGSHVGRTPSQAVDMMRRVRAWYDRHAPRGASRAKAAPRRAPAKAMATARA